MAWGCFGYKGVGYATKITGTMNQLLYKEVLKDEMLKSKEWCLEEKDQEDFVFQQDNAPCHKAHSIMEWFDEKGIRVLDHPPQSPDLNPIENLWRIVKISIYKNHDIKSVKDLWEAFEEEWEKVDAVTCQKLIESMPKRLALVIKARGGSTKY